MNNQNINPNVIKYSTYAFILVFFYFVLNYFLATFFGGFLAYGLTVFISEKMEKSPIFTHHNLLSAIISSGVAILLILLIIVGVFKIYLHLYLHYDSLLEKMESILQQMGMAIPALKDYLPANPHEIIGDMKSWAGEHTSQITTFSKDSLTGTVHLLLGLVLGILLALHRWSEQKAFLLEELSNRFKILNDSFNKVVYSQLKISLINTSLTFIYIYGLKIFGVEILYAKSLILITFLFGLIPVIGNILSNTIIVIISFGTSLYIAIASLIFLIFIHKLEYFINAKIVGKKINANIWELLIALFVMEAIFGMTGFIMAPILYAYIKQELRELGLIDK